MYSPLSKKLLATQGFVKDDALHNYLKKSKSLKFTSHEFQAAISKSLESLIGKDFRLETLPKSRWTGISSDGFVFKVIAKKKVLYFKLTQNFEHQIGTLLSYAYFNEHPNKHLTTPKILEHGHFEYLEKKGFFFTLMTEAKGSDMFSSLKEGNEDELIYFMSFMGRLIASFHKKHVSKLKNYDKLLFTTKVNEELIHEILILPQSLGLETTNSTLSKFIKKIIPCYYISAQEYLKSQQLKSFSTTAIKLSNLAFDRENDKLTIFDTTKLLPFCGPGTAPKWAPEFNFSSFLHHIQFIGIHFNLKEEILMKCEEAYLKAYYDNIEKKIMTREGIVMFTTQAYIRSIKNLIIDSQSDPAFDEKARHMIREFERFQDNQDPFVDRLLNQ